MQIAYTEYVADVPTFVIDRNTAAAPADIIRIVERLADGGYIGELDYVPANTPTDDGAMLKEAI